jgi:hypothetical protein
MSSPDRSDVPSSRRRFIAFGPQRLLASKKSVFTWHDIDRWAGRNVYGFW